MKNKIKVVVYIVLVVVIIIMIILIMGLIKDKSDSVIQQKAQEIVDQIDSSSADTTASIVAEKHESLTADLINENEENLDQPVDDSIAEFYEKRDRGKGYAEERRKLLIENSIFNNAELEGYDTAVVMMEDGFELQLRVITVRTGVFDFEEVY